MTREDFERGLKAIFDAGIKAGHPGLPGTETYNKAMVEIYWTKLKYIPLDAWKHAVHQVQETQQYFPRLHQILEFTSAYRPIMTDYVEAPTDRVAAGPIKWKPLWDSEDERVRVEMIVDANKRLPDEEFTDYLDRIIAIADLIPQGKPVVNNLSEILTT